MEEAIKVMTREDGLELHRTYYIGDIIAIKSVLNGIDRYWVYLIGNKTGVILYNSNPNYDRDMLDPRNPWGYDTRNHPLYFGEGKVSDNIEDLISNFLPHMMEVRKLDRDKLPTEIKSIVDSYNR